MLMSPRVERSMSPQVERCEICRMMRPNALNRMYSASRLREVPLNHREQLEACIEKLSIGATLPDVIIFTSLSLI